MMRGLAPWVLAAAPAMLLVAASAAIGRADDRSDKANGVLNFTMKDIDGKDYDLSKLKGKVVLFVNVASQCGYTKQYSGLQELYEKYEKDGFVIVGVPANEFGKQEPGTNAEIKEFCKKNYDVKFPVFSKIVVKGSGIHPLYQYLTSKDTNPQFAGTIPWNFTKFLVNRKGEVIGRYPPKVEPDSSELTKAIESALAEK